MDFLLKTYFSLIFFLKRFIGPLLFLTMRLWMAQIFWYSGLSKIQSWWTTIMLFKDQYKVPYLSPELAAYLAVGVELSCPILLALGLAARFATIPMLVMTAVIQLTYAVSTENFYWAVLLGLILCYGPGSLSLDNLLLKGVSLKFKRAEAF